MARITDLSIINSNIRVAFQHVGEVTIRYRSNSNWSAPVTTTEDQYDLENLPTGMTYQIAVYEDDQDWDVQSIFLPTPSTVIVDATLEIDRNIYKLKREYGYPATFKKPTETLTDYRTGQITRYYVEWYVTHAIMSETISILKKETKEEVPQYDKRIIISQYDVQHEITLDTTVVIQDKEYNVVKTRNAYHDKVLIIFLKRVKNAS